MENINDCAILNFGQNSVILYKNFGIDYNFYGKKEFTVQVNGDDAWFDTLDEAKAYIDTLF